MSAAEESWIRLAHSYELAESMSDFGKELRRYLEKQPAHIPPCPQCARPMRVVAAVSEAPSAKVQQATFECDCGHSKYD